MRIGLLRRARSTPSTSATCARRRPRGRRSALDLVAFVPAGGAAAPRRRRSRPPADRWPWRASPPPRTRASRPGTPSCGAPGPSYTVETVSRRCSAERPGDDLRARGGRRHLAGDARPGASRSGCSRLVEVAVVDRPGDPTADAAAALSRRPRACAGSRGPSLPISATAIRERAAAGPERALPRARRGGRLHRRAGGSTRERCPPRSSGAARAALAKKAEDVVVLDLRAVRGLHRLLPARSRDRTSASSWPSPTRCSTRCAPQGRRPAHVEGYPRQEWILLDYASFVVHVMTPAHPRLLRPRAAVGRGDARWRSRGDAPRAREALAGVVAELAGDARAACPWSLRLAEARSPVLARGRERHRQGPRRPLAALRRPAARGPLHQGPLSVDPRRAARVGAVRPREGRLHRRPPRQGGQDRDGGRGHRSTSTRSRTSSRRCRPSCSGWSRSGASSGWAGRARSRSTCASWRRRTSTSRRRCARGASARTSSTA